jgi:fructokinase
MLVSNSRGQWQVAAVLDWEFAFSATPYIDFGNRLRKPVGAVSGFESSLTRAYSEVGGILHPQWKRLSLLSDLFAWFDFATRESASPELIADCIKHIEHTIEFVSDKTSN